MEKNSLYQHVNSVALWVSFDYYGESNTSNGKWVVSALSTEECT